MEKLSRSDDAYLELFKAEHDLVKKEKCTQLELKRQDDIERQLFSSLQLALRESQEKEKMRVERTKYWSIIGSVVGALAGMIGKEQKIHVRSLDVGCFPCRCDVVESLPDERVP